MTFKKDLTGTTFKAFSNIYILLYTHTTMMYCMCKNVNHLEGSVEVDCNE